MSKFKCPAFFDWQHCIFLLRFKSEFARHKLDQHGNFKTNPFPQSHFSVLTTIFFLKEYYFTVSRLKFGKLYILRINLRLRLWTKYNFVRFIVNVIHLYVLNKPYKILPFSTISPKITKTPLAMRSMLITFLQEVICHIRFYCLQFGSKNYFNVIKINKTEMPCAMI